MTPKLSVITPSFNQGRYIERTIRSVLDQGYPNLEYVIVDGGSTDETVEIIRRYEDRLAWWVSEPDGGQSEAINKGIERTSGEIVAYINSDDYYLPAAFTTAVIALERSDRNWLAAASADVLEGDPPTDLGVWQPKPPSASERAFRGRHWWLLAPWHVPQPSAFWRRSLFERHGLFRTDIRNTFDAEFMVRLALAGEMPELLPDQVLATFMGHPGQKSRGYRQSRSEIRRFAQIHEPELSDREQRRLAWLKWPVWSWRAVRQAVVDPCLRFAGRLIGYLPGSVRPQIRGRDRRPTLAELSATETKTSRTPRTKTLRVCVDARLGGGRFGGVEQVVIGLAAGLSRLEGDEEYLFLTYRGQDDWIRPYLGGACRLLHCPRRYPRRLARVALERLPAVGTRYAVRDSDGTLERAGAEVVHFPFQDAFLTEVPSIYQPHDLQHLHLPDLFSDWQSRRREAVYRAHCERAEIVVSMTSWGKRDLIEHYELPADKVQVVPGGSVLSEYPPPTPQDLDALRSRISLPEGFLLYPAQTWPHKNHQRLLDALALIRDRDGTSIPLVCPGRQTGHFKQIQESIQSSGLGRTTRFPGFVSPLELRGLYDLATALVFPSLFEGWGLPICEAFSAGLPVASSSATGLPDVVGDAGLIFDPDDTEEIADRVWRLWSDQALRATLAERGAKRAELFSFDHAARLFRAQYREIGQRPLSEEDRILLASPPPA